MLRAGVGEAGGDGGVGADDDEVGVQIPGQARNLVRSSRGVMSLGEFGYARVARSRMEVMSVQGPDDRVLAAAGADNEDAHSGQSR